MMEVYARECRIVALYIRKEASLCDYYYTVASLLLSLDYVLRSTLLDI